MGCPDYLVSFYNRHGRIQNILDTHGYENADRFFSTVLYVFMIKLIKNQVLVKPVTKRCIKTLCLIFVIGHPEHILYPKTCINYFRKGNYALSTGDRNVVLA